MQKIIISQAIIDVLLFPAGHQDGTQLHQMKVLRDAWKRSSERRSNLADRPFPPGQKPQDQHSLGITEYPAEGCLSPGEYLNV